MNGTDFDAGAATELRIKQQVSRAVAVALRTFLIPALADKAHKVLLHELGLPGGQAHREPSNASTDNDTHAAGNGTPAKNGKRKRAVNPDRKPRGITMFNLFQAKVTRMLKESGMELDKDKRLLSQSAALWSAADQKLKDDMKLCYASFLDECNEKRHGGEQLDLHNALPEFEKAHPLPPSVHDGIKKLVDSAGPLAPAETDGSKKTAGQQSPELPHDTAAGAAVEPGTTETSNKPKKKKKKRSKEQAGQLQPAEQPASESKKKKKKKKPADEE